MALHVKIHENCTFAPLLQVCSMTWKAVQQAVPLKWQLLLVEDDTGDKEEKRKEQAEEEVGSHMETRWEFIYWQLLILALVLVSSLKGQEDG